MKFSYVAKDKEGKKIKGNLNAENEQAVADMLLRSGLIPTQVKPEADNSIDDFLIKHLKLGLPKIEDIMMLCKQMYALTKAGVPLARSIKVVTISTNNLALKMALNEVFTELESGMALSAAMNKHRSIFPNLMIALVGIGENTGSLDQIFKQLSLHFEREADTRKKIKSAMRYPTMVVLVIVVAVAIINVVVIPAFSGFFKQFKAELPIPTKILIAASDYTIQYWYWMILFLVGGLSGFIYFINTKEGEFIYDRFKLRIPVVGSVIKKALLARFSRMFSLCLKTGVPLLQSIQLIAYASDNVFVQDKIMNMRGDIEKGESITQSAKNTHMFSDLVIQMMLIGEETGETDKLFEEVGSYYEQEVDYEVARLGASIEPILIAVISVIVLILALGVFLPMWNVSQISLGQA